MVQGSQKRQYASMSDCTNQDRAVCGSDIRYIWGEVGPRVQFAQLFGSTVGSRSFISELEGLRV
jgi:hypothetical protein